MRIQCTHGYFEFYETAPGQISDFVSRYGLEIVRAGERYVFAAQKGALDYAIRGGTFFGAPVSVTFEGNPWAIMRMNGIVYDFLTGLHVPIASVTRKVEILAAGNAYLSNGMILPGSLTDDGKRVTDYAAFYIPQRANFKYDWIETT